MIFRTQTGSRYEIDYENKQVRRLAGVSNPTSHQGKDGEWKPYLNISDVIVGASVSIIWGVGPYNPDSSNELLMRIKTTLTSEVIAIES